MSAEKTTQSDTVITAKGEVRRGRVIPTHNRWRSASVNLYVYALIGLVLFLGTVQVAKAMDLWSTSGKVTTSGEKVSATGADPAEIKGWMTIQEVLTAYKVPQQDFYTRFKIPADTAVTTPLKDLEDISPDFSITSVREWLTERMKE